VIKKGMKAEIRVDRYEGFASGQAIDLVLSWDGLASGGTQSGDLKDELFKHPDQIVQIAESIDHTTGSKLVDDTTGWTATHGYIGTERVSVTVIDGTHLNLTARGLSGSRANVYSVRSPTFSHIANRPIVWRGREVTLWRILIGPDGSIIDSTLCDSSSGFQRVIWRGYVDGPPKAVTEGISLRALPLVRRLALPIGHSVGADVYQCMPLEDGGIGSMDAFNEALANMPVRVPPGSVLFTWGLAQKDGSQLSGEVVVKESHPDGCYTLAQLAQGMFTTQAHMGDGIFNKISGAGTGFGVNAIGAFVFFKQTNVLFAAQPVIELHFQCVDSALDLDKCFLTVPSHPPYFMIPGVYQWEHHQATGGGGYTVADGYQSITIPLNLMPIPAGPFWLPLKQTEGNEWNDVALPSSGFGIIEQNDSKLICEWDQKIDSFDTLDAPGVTMVRLNKIDAVKGSPNVWAGADLKYISGKIGSVKDCLLTLMQSSGAGNRGSFDTLAVGQGCGIDEDQIDEVSLGYPGISDFEITLYAEGKTSVSDLLGGHLALRQLCFVQRLTDTDTVQAGASIRGDVVLSLVSCTAPVIDSSSPTISESEMVLEAIEAPELAEVPNAISVQVNTLLGPNDQSIDVQDVPRIQSEGPRTQSYKAPGLSMAEALQLCASVIAQGDGQVLFQVQVASWVEVQPGDPVNLTLAHPMIYDYATGTRGPASIAARCLGWSTDLYDGTQTLVLLIAGSAIGVGPLSPSVQILSKPTSTSVTVSSDDLKWLSNGATVAIFNPGQEAAATPQIAEHTISTISGTTINFSSALASWVGTTSIITYPAVGSCNERQARFTHNSAAYRVQ
tara:strand:+ start:13866 stop:16385 length:2520 start_codon:yes stop_codon:yes gene_type:complete